jgi:hypothetical protein
MRLASQCGGRHEDDLVISGHGTHTWAGGFCRDRNRPGDRLEVVASSKDWFEVSFLHLRGWIHSSSVTTKKVSLTTTKTVGAETTAEEVTLAGKGFTKEVEDQYRSDHPSQNFAAVDEILRQQPSEKELEQFRRQGKLGEFGGEA